MKRPIVLNQSSFKDFQNCQRLYGWKRIQGLAPVGRRGVLEIGTAVHLGLAVFHAGGINDANDFLPQLDVDADEEERAEYNIARARLEAVLKQTPLDQAVFAAAHKLTERAGPSSSFMDKSLEDALAIVTTILPAYVKRWAPEGELWHPLNQEIECLVEVGDGTQNYLRLKSDNLSSAKGGLYLVDYKTMGKLDPRDMLKYEMDIQLTAYIYGLTKQLTSDALSRGEEPVFIRGAIIDVLVKTQTPQFAREFFSRTLDELAEFEGEWNEVSDRIRAQHDRVYAGEDWKIVFPKSTEHCFHYGTCAFRDVCLKDTPVRRALYNTREPDYVDTAQEELTRIWRMEVVK